MTKYEAVSTSNDVLVTAEDSNRNVWSTNVPHVKTEVKQLCTAGQVKRPLRPPLHPSCRRNWLHREYWSVNVSLVCTWVKDLPQTDITAHNIPALHWHQLCCWYMLPLISQQEQSTAWHTQNAPKVVPMISSNSSTV